MRELKIIFFFLPFAYLLLAYHLFKQGDGWAALLMVVLSALFGVLAFGLIFNRTSRGN